MNLRRILVVTTILVSFVQAAGGSPSGAVVFWLTLFGAAMLAAPGEFRRAGSRRIM